MTAFLKKTVIVFIVFLAFGFFAKTTFAATGVIIPGFQESAFDHTDLNNDGIFDVINWIPRCGATAPANNCTSPVTVSDTQLTGLIWGETVGYISLNCTNVIPGDPNNGCSQNNNFHVTNDGAGHLTGFAWGHSTGYISFSCTNPLPGFPSGDCSQNGNFGVTIDPTTGEFSGYAWSHSYGYIKFACPGTDTNGDTFPDTCVTTDWRPSSSQVNGVCGAANSQVLTSIPTVPSDICSAGNATAITHVTGGWVWDCIGTGGGTTDHCAASQQLPPPCGGQSCVTGGSGPVLKIITHVTNLNGGTLAPLNFSVHVKEGGLDLVDLSGNAISPAFGVDTPGRSYQAIDGDTYSIREDSINGYITTISGDCDASGNVSFAAGFTGSKTCVITNIDTATPQLCLDSFATNNGGPLPCHYSHLLCMDIGANNYGQALPCGYNDNLCHDVNATNNGGQSPCQYLQVCQDALATNNGGPLPCQYPQNICRDNSALNFGGQAPCRYVHNIIGCVGNNCGNLPPVIPQMSTQARMPLWLLELLGMIGLASTIPGLVSRFGSLALAFAFDRKKRRGIVFDSETREPLDPAYVSLVSMVTGQEIQSQITDLEGRYGFILQPGTYKIVANKTHYQFPSVRLAGKTTDPVYDNLYFGEVFTVNDPDQVVVMNIPMDATGTDWNQVEKRRMNLVKYFIGHQINWGWLFEIMFIIGFMSALVVTYFSPIVWNIVMCVLYVILAIIQISGFGPISAGKISRNGAPLPYGVVHIFNKNLNREVAKKVTSPSGGYYALVPKADYYVTIDQKNGDAYSPIYTSESIKAHDGVINKEFDL